MAEAVRTARCCCGACTIEVAGEPSLNAICHCHSCKRRTGSAFGWSVYFPDTQLRAKAGPLTTYYAETTDTHRHFCTRCGTTLFWKTAAFMPGDTGIAGGCFADSTPPIGEPAFSVSDDRRCRWMALPENWMKSP